MQAELLVVRRRNVNFSFDFLPEDAKKWLFVSFNEAPEDGSPQVVFFLEEVFEAGVRRLLCYHASCRLPR